ncbi:Hypothetical predicted protein [Olea europaea subsp. europaea]|uniref:Uncharacterized protein n=1 Tax=Olea europaea subsp. europaea TaxID=158383 RepID=A0A8S0UBM9_OLEEU|nr:Hypothetical predicted protein [Olea europaea subsp. europaea]
MLLEKFAEDLVPIVSLSCELAIRKLDCERSARHFLVGYVANVENDVGYMGMGLTADTTVSRDTKIAQVF